MNDATVAEVLKTLNRIEMEFNRISEIREEDRSAAEKRHFDLVARLDSYAEKALAIETAFLIHEGRPDFAGHRADHFSRKRIGDWLETAFSRSMLKAFEYFSIAFIAWLIYAIWAAVLKGPTK